MIGMILFCLSVCDAVHCVVGLVINRSRVRLPAMHCRVSTWMGDRLWAGKPSWYVTSHLGQLILPSLWGK